MKIHIITIFPENFECFFRDSIIWKAQKKWLFEVELYKLNNFSDNKTKRVDDKAYWMHGQVISPKPLDKAINYIFNKLWKKILVIYMSPKWKILTQSRVEKYYKKLQNEEFIIVCGHYEGIDQRIIDLYVDLEISIGKYILTSGELAAQVFLDTLIRHIPGVLGNKDSLDEDSFSKKFFRRKEYPVYTKPQEFRWLKVPNILLSWNHKKIDTWKINNLK